MGAPVLKTLSETMRGLIEAVSQLQHDAPSESQLNAIVARGEFRPAEDEAIGFWFARFLSIRESLWAVIEDVLAVLDQPASPLKRQSELRYFLLGYAAVCLLIRIDRIMLFEVAHHSITQRKLNEAFPEYRIPRKQYTKIFSAFVDQKNVFAIRDAMNYRRKNRRELLMLGSDPQVGFIAQQLGELESSLNPSKRSHLKRAWSYVSHKWRRRGIVSSKYILAAIMEGVGRAASEFVEKKNKRVSGEVLDSIAGFLQPGDVIITRHAKALTNLFIPGFWPHAALYVGATEQREAGNFVLEARKDGVRLRPLQDTLSVDAFVVLRPNLDSESIDKAIERAFTHEGKMYNFDFDFFNSDRVVCTELIYRSYDGLDGLRFPLHDRAGRKVHTAEDFLDFAIDTEAFEPVAIFGVDACDGAVMFGEAVCDTLVASYRSQS
jgi:uncharacterized protein YycO